MPVVFNEPLSFLQRMVEYMEYAQLLRQANQEEDPISRIQVSISHLDHCVLFPKPTKSVAVQTDRNNIYLIDFVGNRHKDRSRRS